MTYMYVVRSLSRTLRGPVKKVQKITCRFFRVNKTRFRRRIHHDLFSSELLLFFHNFLNFGLTQGCVEILLYFSTNFCGVKWPYWRKRRIIAPALPRVASNKHVHNLLREISENVQSLAHLRLETVNSQENIKLGEVSLTTRLLFKCKLTQFMGLIMWIRLPFDTYCNCKGRKFRKFNLKQGYLLTSDACFAIFCKYQNEKFQLKMSVFFKNHKSVF